MLFHFSSLQCYGCRIGRSNLHVQVSVAQIADLDPVELEHALRGFLLKLQFADAWMKQLPEGVQLHTPINTIPTKCVC